MARNTLLILLWKSRVWTFPHSSLSSAENILREISSIKVEVCHLDSLVLVQKVQLKLEVKGLLGVLLSNFLLNYQIENLDPLVQRAIASASRVPNLRRKSGVLFITSDTLTL